VRLPKIEGAALKKVGLATYRLTLPDGRASTIRRIGRAGRYSIWRIVTLPGRLSPRFVCLKDAAHAAKLALEAAAGFVLSGEAVQPTHRKAAQRHSRGPYDPARAAQLRAPA
jgi:hypothetical protein